jgi:carboxypeptidase Taq
MLQWWHSKHRPTEYWMPTPLTELKQWAAEISDLRKACAVLDWDKNTMMPPLGAPLRTEQLATLERITHERFTSERTGELITAAEAELDGIPADSIEARSVSESRRLYEKDRRVPLELAVARAKAASEAYEIWVSARKADDFAAFSPALERNVELTREYVSCFDGYDDPYDVLLDDFAPGLPTARVTDLFTALKGELLPLIAAVRGREIDVTPLHVRYPVDGQRKVVDQALRWMGFNDAGWRLDDTVHPFETSFSITDVRLTTRYVDDYFPTSLYGAMHECGHGLYEAGIAPNLERTPLGSIRSSAIHESQSRLWENMVGRGKPFTGALLSSVRENSGGLLRDLDHQTLFRAVNAVSPSTIRIEADEATYGLHIILRFELERALLAGDLAVSDLPGAWNDRMREYLGVEVPSNAEGVLQDVHWSAGLFGYFPTYALGNLIAGQLWERVRSDLPDLDEQLAAHELQGLREWLREKVHRHGSRYSDAELLDRVVGGPITVGPFISYLKAKLGDVYGITLA